MDSIGVNLQAVRERIGNAARQHGRGFAEVGLIAVSKTFGADAVAVARKHGQTAFGESHAQEGVAKIAATPDPTLKWHFIGPIQSNKTRLIAQYFDWVHSIERFNIAERLSAARAAGLAPLQVCIQVKIGDERSKSGVPASEALALARAVVELPRLKLRGLMAVPPASADHAQQRRHFAQLRQLKDAIVRSGIALDTLSMGMSDDLEAAIAEGATLVRVGTAIFGPRRKV